MEPVVPFNASAVAAATFLVLATWLNTRNGPGSVVSLLLLGFSFGVALHVHPTTAPLGLLGVEALHRSWRDRERFAACLAAFLVGPTVLFAPYVVSQAMNGWPDLSTAHGYVATHLAPGTLLLAPQLLFAELYGGPRFAALDLARWSPTAASALGCAVLALTIGALIGAFRAEPTRRRALWLFGGTTLGLLPWLLLLRPTTPFYFTNVLAPALGGFIAMGWVSAFARSLRAHAELWLACGALALQILVFAGFARNAREGGHGTSAQALDVKDFSVAFIAPDVWFPAVHRASLGRLLCDHRPIALHAAVAFVEDRSVGTDALFSCGDDRQVSLGGSGAASHLVGLAHVEWKILGVQPACRIGPLGLVMTPGPAAPMAPQAIAEGTRYFPREVSTTPDVSGEESLVTDGPGIVLVSNFLFGYERLSAVTVTANGRAINPAFERSVSRAYIAPPGPDRVEWRIRYSASSPSAIDIVFVPVSALQSPLAC